jgi:hypothetical protein
MMEAVYIVLNLRQRQYWLKGHVGGGITCDYRLVILSFICEINQN